VKWYIAKCPTGAEEHAVNDLKFMLSKMHALENIGEHLVPYEKTRSHNSRKNVANYVFIQLDLTEDVMKAFNKAKIISLMLDENLKAITVSQEEVTNMQETIASRKQFAEESEFVPGQSVQVLEAPFEDFMATVEKFDKVKQIVTVSVPILGRQVSVELPFNSIKRIIG